MKIAVLGSASSSVGKAPFKNAAYHEWTQGKLDSLQRAHDAVPGDWDIWGCSPGCWAVIPRATRWFEVHRWETGVPWLSPEYIEFLRRFKGPVYTGGTVPEITQHVAYPLDRIEEKFSSYFLTSSLALMMALAIDEIERVRAARAAKNGALLPAWVDPAEIEKADKDDIIGLWGVDMAAADEYAYQRPGCQFFVIEALRRGIGVYLPPESDLMRPMPVYGISEWDHNYIKLTSRARELSAGAQRMQAQLEEAKVNIAGLQGEQHALQAFVSTWTSPYGMPVGMVLRQEDGTGLGSGITHYDGRPITRMTVADAPEKPVLEAMAESPDAQLGRGLATVLRSHACEGEATEHTLQRLLGEVTVSRQHSALLQPYCGAGESTPDTLRRIIGAAVEAGAKRPAKSGKRRRQ